MTTDLSEKNANYTPQNPWIWYVVVKQIVLYPRSIIELVEQNGLYSYTWLYNTVLVLHKVYSTSPVLHNCNKHEGTRKLNIDEMKLMSQEHLISLLACRPKVPKGLPSIHPGGNLRGCGVYRPCPRS